MKRTLSFLMALLMAISLTPAAFASQPENPFSDVPADSYYEEAVLWALENGVTTGVTDTQFQPGATCTRGQVATFLWRAKGRPEPTISNPFTDVSASSPFYKAILWAYENGITTGTTTTTFNPGGTCSSAHVVTFLWRSEGEPSADGTSTLAADYPANAYYKDAVAWADGMGLLGGTGAAFKPGEPCPRADVVTYLYRSSDAGAADRSKAYTPDFDAWTSNYNWNRTSKLRKENGTLVIENSVPNDANFAQVVRVKPHTDYMLSAMIRVDGYAQGKERPGGGTIGILPTDGVNDYVTSPVWTESRIVFNTGDRDTVTLRASNGGTSATTSGTAYISDIVLEELKSDNHWNVLALVYQNVDTGTYKNSFSQSDIQKIQDTLRKFPDDVRALSGGRMVIDRLDTVVIEEPIRTLSNENANPTRGPGQDIDFDYLLQGKDYHQIVIYAPVSGANRTESKWGGLGGSAYTYHGKKIWTCTINYIQYSDRFQTYTRDGHSADPQNLPWILHEVLHCVESNSRSRGITDFEVVHSRMDPEHSGYAAGYDEQPYSWLDWYSDLMRDTITGGGRGFQPDSFLVSHLPVED